MLQGRRAQGLLAALLLCAAVAVAPMVASGAKKKTKLKPFAATATVNAGIPNGAAATKSVPVLSTITVPKKYKGKVVGDVNVTGLQTTGSAAGAAAQLVLSLRAPNGRTVVLSRGMGDQSLGPWTLDDDTNVSICNAPAPICPNPNQSLARPFAGTSNLAYNDNPALTPLQGFDGIPMKGAWTLSAADTGAGPTSVLNQWGLKVTPAKPVKG